MATEVHFSRATYISHKMSSSGTPVGLSFTTTRRNARMRGTGIEGEGDGILEHVGCISSTLQGRYAFDPPKANKKRKRLMFNSALSRRDGEANSMSLKVVDSEVLAEEDVT